MTSKASVAFEQSAARLECSESDYLLLKGAGITCMDQFYFQIHTPQELEDFTHEEIFPYAAYLDNGQIQVFARPAEDGDWAAWRRSSDAAGIRRLWTVSKDTSKKELEKKDEEEAPKVTRLVLMDLESKAVNRGMDAPVSDVDRPSTYCMGKVMGIPTHCTYLDWETYSTLDDEESAIRAGKKPTKTSLEVSGQTLKLTQQGSDFSTSKVEDLVRMQEVLKIRSVAHEMAGLVSTAVYQRYTNMYVTKLRQTTPHQMRKPTLNEVRMVDRLIHREAMQRLARGQNSLEETFLWFLSINGRQHKYWNFLEPQVASLPDQGVQVGDFKHPKEPAYPPPGPPVPTAVEQTKAVGQGKCSVCGKTRADHPRKQFCSTRADKGEGKRSQQQQWQKKDHDNKRKGAYRRDDGKGDAKRRR